MFLFSHPALEILYGFAAGDVTLSARQRRHIASCVRCQDEIRSVRKLRSEAAAFRGPPATERLLAEIRGRLANGDAVILPQHSPVPGRRIGAVPGMAAAGTGIVMLALWFVYSAPNLSAGASGGELRLIPAKPEHGDSISVEYRAAAALAGESWLRVRARYRSLWGDPYDHAARHRSALILVRQRDGLFRGKFVLPDSVVYAALAVEDSSARFVDSNERRFWEILVHDAGRPTSHALVQREYDLMGRNAEEAAATARQRALLYPELPDAWASVSVHESWVHGDAYADTALAGHRARMLELHRRWSASDQVPIDIAWGMLGYAVQTVRRGDSAGVEVRNHWRRLIDRDTSSGRIGLQIRWWRLNNGATEPRAAAESLLVAERFWQGVGGKEPLGVLVGFQLARRSGDTSAILTWLDRRAKLMHRVQEHLYHEFLAHPDLRKHMLVRLRALADTLVTTADDARRPLELTRTEAARTDSARARAVWGMIAEGELASGDTAASLRSFERATAADWTPLLFRKAADTWLAAGDTSTGLWMLALAAVDPGAGGQVDSLAEHGRRLAGKASWDALIKTAELEMRRRVMADAVNVELPASIRLLNKEEKEIQFADLTAGKTAVVTFWSRNCWPSRRQMPQVKALHERLNGRGIALVAIATEGVNPDVKQYLESEGIDIPVFFDAHKDAARAFNQWATPVYHVVDASGRLRFRLSSLDRVVAEAVALDGER